MDMIHKILFLPISKIKKYIKNKKNKNKMDYQSKKVKTEIEKLIFENNNFTCMKLMVGITQEKQV